MYKENTGRVGHDPIIATILDKIVDVTQCDPCFIHPDDKLGECFGLERTQIQFILWESAKSLQLNVEFENCRVSDMSPRELVETLNRWKCMGDGERGSWGRAA